MINALSKARVLPNQEHGPKAALITIFVHLQQVTMCNVKVVTLNDEVIDSPVNIVEMNLVFPFISWPETQLKMDES